jgi:glycosyltransferase involved in cell wall biosynthesis
MVDDPQKSRESLAPKVTVVIPCRNEVRYIRGVIDSVLAAERPEGGIEILVADGMSDDGTRELLQEIAQREPILRVIDNSEWIVSTGLNAAIRAARGDTIVRLDAHAYYEPDYIVRVVDWLHRTKADVVGGVMLVEPTDDTFLGRAIAHSIGHRFGSGNAHYKTARVTEPRHVDTVPFGCFRRQLFEEIGFFREDLARSQDMEFNLRVRAKGGTILLVPDVRCRYQARSDLGRVIRYYFSNGFWVVFPLKFGVRAFKLRHMVPFAFVASLVISLALWPWTPWGGYLFVAALGSYLLAAGAAALHIAWREKRLEYLLTMPPAFLLLHVVHGAGTAYAWGCLLLEWTLPKVIFRKQTPTARV